MSTRKRRRKICSRCGKLKPFVDYHKQTRTHDGLAPACKPCNLSRMKSYYKLLSREEKLKRQKRTALWNKSHPERAKEIYTKGERKRRMELLKAYGGENPKCVCCGEYRWQFLSIDHINGGGNKHKKKIGYPTIGAWLRKMGYPKKGFQILCFNCNCAKGFYGECPHIQEKKLCV